MSKRKSEFSTLSIVPAGCPSRCTSRKSRVVAHCFPLASRELRVALGLKLPSCVQPPLHEQLASWLWQRCPEDKRPVPLTSILQNLLLPAAQCVLPTSVEDPSWGPQNLKSQGLLLSNLLQARRCLKQLMRNE